MWHVRQISRKKTGEGLREKDDETMSMSSFISFHSRAESELGGDFKKPRRWWKVSQPFEQLWCGINPTTFLVSRILETNNEEIFPIRGSHVEYEGPWNI